MIKNFAKYRKQEIARDYISRLQDRTFPTAVECKQDKFDIYEPLTDAFDKSAQPYVQEQSSQVEKIELINGSTLEDVALGTT